MASGGGVGPGSATSRRRQLSWRQLGAFVAALLLLVFLYSRANSATVMSSLGLGAAAPGGGEELWLTADEEAFYAGIEAEKAAFRERMKAREAGARAREEKERRERESAPLRVYWMRECGCTGMEEESVHLLFHLARRGVPVATNKCDKPCSRPEELNKVIAGIETDADEADVPHDVAVLHYAFRGVCPERNTRKFVIARSMFETDGLESPAVSRCNSDHTGEIWVPSSFNKRTFTSAGVLEDKIRVVPETIDFDFFARRESPAALSFTLPKRGFRFLTAFKWEGRKNWRGLIDAYLRTFSHDDDVGLYLKVKSYMGNDPVRELNSHIADQGHDLEALPLVHVILDHISSDEMAALYQACDAFVLPTHGEGWGLPTFEAMSMELPVITTDWGGSTEFANNDNAYMVPVKELVDATWEGRPIPGRWAEPDQAELGRLMRHVFENRAEAREKGRRARQDIMRRFAGPLVAASIAERLEELRPVVHRHNRRAEHAPSGWNPFVTDRERDWLEKGVERRIARRKAKTGGGAASAASGASDSGEGESKSL